MTGNYNELCKAEESPGGRTRVMVTKTFPPYLFFSSGFTLDSARSCEILCLLDQQYEIGKQSCSVSALQLHLENLNAFFHINMFSQRLTAELLQRSGGSSTSLLKICRWEQPTWSRAAVAVSSLRDSANVATPPRRGSWLLSAAFSTCRAFRDGSERLLPSRAVFNVALCVNRVVFLGPICSFLRAALVGQTELKVEVTPQTRDARPCPAAFF